jgi:hypothetical protein
MSATLVVLCSDSEGFSPTHQEAPSGGTTARRLSRFFDLGTVGETVWDRTFLLSVTLLAATRVANQGRSRKHRNAG